MTQAVEAEDHGRYSDGQMCGKHLWKGTFVSWLCDGFCKNVHRGAGGFPAGEGNFQNGSSPWITFLLAKVGISLPQADRQTDRQTDPLLSLEYMLSVATGVPEGGIHGRGHCSRWEVPAYRIPVGPLAGCHDSKQDEEGDGTEPDGRRPLCSGSTSCSSPVLAHTLPGQARRSK